MPSPIPKPCGVCGRRVDSGKGRCAEHQGRAYKLPVSCKVCGKLGPSSFCDLHKPEPYTERQQPEAARVEAQPWRKGYRDPNYHRERQAVLRRSAGACEKCGRSDQPLEVDHIIPLSVASSQAEIRELNKRGNLQALCRPCHVAKTKRRRA